MAVSAAAVTAKLVALTLSDWNGRTVVFFCYCSISDPCYFNCHHDYVHAFWDCRP